MDNEKAHNIPGNGHKFNPIVVAVVSAMLGSGGGVALVFNTPLGQQIARPDPFTGTQAGQLEARLQHVEGEMDAHIRQHPDAVNQFDRRITTLEVQYNGIIQYLERIDKKLDRLSP